MARATTSSVGATGCACTSRMPRPGSPARHRQPRPVSCAPGSGRAAGSRPAALASGATEGADPAAAGEVAAGARRSGRRLGHQEDEDQVGKLQPRRPPRLAQPGTGQEAEQCLEYIVVHELVHLLERHHNERFTALMDGYMPQWRQYRDMLRKSPLGHEEWEY
jgi:hypothetical protein